MASCRSTSHPCGGREFCLFHRVRKSHRQSQCCFEGVFHPPFLCQTRSAVKGSIIFEIFIVVTLVTPSFSNRLVVQRSDGPLIGSSGQWNYRQTESSLCLLEGGGIWKYKLSFFKSAWRANVKQASLGTKTHCYTMVLLSPALSTYWKTRKKPC